VANDLGVNAQRLHERLEQLKETNPVLGHRGVRLGVTSPEIYQAQVRAILEAACECAREGTTVRPEIMVPLVGLTAELQKVRELVEQTAQAVLTEYEQSFDYAIGTMIEVPRAALIADRLAHHADFFSFGTNDLTQLMYGWSRDDAGKFLAHYQQEGLLVESPLMCLDEDGVGEILKVAVERGREANPRLQLGVCGEHGGDPAAIGFFHRLGLDYVSCSPYRVPVARLAAAHAALGLL
jgi:pyruvate,orthophosphate dikinase